MKYVELGRTGLTVSRFALGCMRFPQIKDADGKEHIDEAEAIKMVRYAVDNGVTYIDTAYAYEGSEVVVGKALRDGYRERVTLVTKIPVWLVKEKGDLRRLLDEQLARLQTDHIDICLLHNLFYENWEIVKKFDAIDEMKQFKAEGKIRFIACSVHERLEHWKTVVDAFDWDLMMMQYNYVDKFNQAGVEGLNYATGKGIPIAVMEPLHGGMLAQEPPKEIADALAAVPGDSYAEKSFKWLYDQEKCSVILSGCSSMEQLAENIKIFNKSETNCLTDEERLCFDKAREKWAEKTLVPCTGCAYCMPCPQGVDIPMIFELYNTTARVTNADHAQLWLYEQVLKSAKNDASQCVECGQCETHCPQRIKIMSVLKDADAKLNGK